MRGKYYEITSIMRGVRAGLSPLFLITVKKGLGVKGLGKELREKLGQLVHGVDVKSPPMW